jgi:hypothetical protein
VDGAGEVGPAVEVGDAEGGGVGDGAGDPGVSVGPGVVICIGLGVGDDPDGVTVAVVPAHAARRAPRKRDAAWRFAFICRHRLCCGLSRR